MCLDVFKQLKVLLLNSRSIYLSVEYFIQVHPFIYIMMTRALFIAKLNVWCKKFLINNSKKELHVLFSWNKIRSYSFKLCNRKSFWIVGVKKYSCLFFEINCHSELLPNIRFLVKINGRVMTSSYSSSPAGECLGKFFYRSSISKFLEISHNWTPPLTPVFKGRGLSFRNFWKSGV